MHFLSVSSGTDDLAGAIPLILISVALAILISIIVVKLERKLREGPKRASQTTDSCQRYSSYLKADLHPRSWLTNFGQVSIKHLLVMSLFYLGVGIGLATAGTVLIAYLDPSYEEPVLPISLFDALAAGPGEETLFFGIPLYVSGNQYIVLVLGSLWALGHIFNTTDVGLLLLALLGGVIMYFMLRRRDPKMARNGLLVGIVLAIVRFAVSRVMIYFGSLPNFPSL